MNKLKLDQKKRTQRSIETQLRIQMKKHHAPSVELIESLIWDW